MANNDAFIRLDDLSVFLAVCEMRGFRSAAKRLGLSPSRVSETITQLELRLGTPLLIRTTRSVTPTATGQALADRLLPVFTETRAALQDAASAERDVRGLLRLNVTGAVMVDILPPLLDRFLAAHPHVRVELVVEDRLVDIAAAGCDAGIRYGEHLAQDMIAVPIGPARQRVALAAAPAYLATRVMPLHPRDLLQHDCIRLRFSSGALVAWTFEHGDETITVDPPGRLIIGVDGAAGAIALAARGHGIIATFENWLQPFLSSGVLRPVYRSGGSALRALDSISRTVSCLRRCGPSSTSLRRTIPMQSVRAGKWTPPRSERCYSQKGASGLKPLKDKVASIQPLASERKPG